MDTNNTSKFLFYHFNNLRHDLNEDAYKTRHTIVSDDQTHWKFYSVEIDCWRFPNVT